MSIKLPADFLSSGTVANPASGAVLIDTQAITAGYSQYGFYECSLTLYATATATFEVGVYNGDDTAATVFRYAVQSGSSQSIRLPCIPIVDGQKFKLKAAVAVNGTVNVSLNISNTSGV